MPTEKPNPAEVLSPPGRGVSLPERQGGDAGTPWAGGLVPAAEPSRQAGAARTVLIAAGGTGGHLFPGIAVADELRARDASTRVVFAGTPKGLEGRLVPNAGYELELLPILPLNGVGAKRALAGLLALPWGLVRAARLVRRLAPVAVLGVGGYAGGPVCLAAALLGVRTIILEPNAVPGFTNRILGPFADAAACSFAETAERFGRKGVVTGNPVRGGFASLKPRNPGRPCILLAFGGSQGSRILNESLVAAIPHLPPPTELRIVHQTGPSALERTSRAWAAAGRDAEVLAFVDDMQQRMGDADLVLARSGATTCAELAAAGRPSVLIPFAAAADDHQRRNARAMEAEGAAVVLEEGEASGERLGGLLTGLVADPKRLLRMGEAARRLGRPGAASRVADLLLGEAPRV